MSLYDMSLCDILHNNLFMDEFMGVLETYHEYLPLREATFLILLSLAPSPKHGYGILKEVESLSNGRVVFSTGTLYGALKRLLTQAWIERINPSASQFDGRDKKIYKLTELGNKIMQAEVARLKYLVAVANNEQLENPL